MPVPEKSLQEQIAALAHRLSYSSGVPIAGSFVLADALVRLENRVQELERELAEVKYNRPPHLQHAERR